MRALLFERKSPCPVPERGRGPVAGQAHGRRHAVRDPAERCGYPERTSGWAHPKDWLGIEDKKVIEYSVTMRASISGTLQALDLKSGRIGKALPLEAVPVVTQRSREGYPEGVSTDEVQRQAVAMIAVQIERVFLPGPRSGSSSSSTTRTAA